MGLFDRVIYPGECENCRRKITEFQTQDTSNPAIIGVELHRVNYFYAFCYCGAFVAYQRKGVDEFRIFTTVPERTRTYHGHAQPAYPDGEGPEA